MTDEGELIARRYRLLTQIGTGAMGVVWQGRDERLDRIVAVKKLLLSSGTSETEAEEANRRAMREGRITARLHHPHAITVYDVALHEGKPCLIMEYLPAESLSTVLATRGTLPAEEVARIGSQIASALVAAHEAGIVHRDIKPGNVLLTDDGTAKITDFGISRAVGDGTVTATGIVAGTPAYLAPEVAQGLDAGFASDVFSLGSTLYAAVEGSPPFGLDDNFLALLYRIATNEITPPRQSGPLTPVLTRILERDLSRRPSMQQAHELLAAVAGLRPSTARTWRAAAVPSPKPPPAPEPSSAPEPPPTPTASPAPKTRTSDAADAPDPGPPTLPPTLPPTVVPTALPDPTPDRAPTDQPSPAGRWQQRWAIAAATVVAIVALAVGVAFATSPNDDGRRTAAPASVTPSTTTADTPTAAQEPAPREQIPPPSPTAVTTPPAVPAPAPAPSPPTTAASPPDNPEQLATAVTDYYALMPADLQAGWSRLTADYQTNHAKGFDGYQRFWNAIQRVEISDVSARSPSTVTATLDYFYKDGRAVTEQTRFGLVAEDGQWKIASSSVISSRTIAS